MRKAFTLLLVVFTSLIATSQCLMYPVLLNERIQQSSLVIEGKVIDKVSFWNNQHTKIYTSNLIEVYKSFKNSAPTYLEIITEGGIVNEDMHKVEPSLQLNVDEIGVFTLIQNNEPSQFGKQVYEAYASAQGFIKYNLRENVGSEPFQKYENLSTTLYSIIDGYTNNNYTLIKPINLFQAQNNINTSQAVAAISGFSPTTITAGTKSILTINGSGFGTTINASQIQFRRADDGGATFISPIASEIVSWTATQIQVRVPADAGTGIIRVQGVSSTATLTIPYAHLNVTSGANTFVTKHINKASSGGYLWTYNTSFFANTAAKASFERAFQAWRCGTFINWSLATTTTSIAASGSDGVNIVTFNSSLPAGVLGNCGSYYSGCGTGTAATWFVNEIDIQFANTPGSGGTTWQYGTANPSFSQYDFESVAAHELGHGHQLGHVIRSVDLMHFNIGNGQTKRNLNTNDIDGGNAVMTRNTTAGGTCSNPLMIPLNASNCSLSTSSITASFNTPTSACINTPITFTNTSTGNPTSYTWTTSGATAATSTSTNAVFTFTTTGVRTVTLVAASGTLTSTTTRTLTVNASPTVSVNSPTICAGTSTVLTASGASTYSWNTGATTSTLSVSPTVNTNYTVTGTNTLGCRNTRTTSITVRATPTVAVTSASVCPGTATVLTASGASTYSWNTGATTSTLSASPTVNTNYTVVGTNSVGCSQTRTTTITMRATPTVAVNSATICSGSSATLTASGANTYSWNTGATNASIVVSPTSNTTYTVIGTNTAGCSQTRTTSVVVSSSPTVAINSATICAGTSTVLSASGANTYTWNTGANTSTISVNPTANTVYTVTGRLTGCATSDVKTATVTVRATPTVAVTSASVCPGTATVLTASGASTYSWNTGATTSTLSASPTVNTNYTVVGTNSVGCSQTRTTTITMRATPTVTVNSATICSGSSATLTASGATTYSWNTGATNASITVSPSSNTNYTVTGTNSVGCSQTKTTSVVVTSSPTVSVNSATICAGTSTVLSASGANTYTWNTGANTSTISVNPTSNTIYTVTGNLNGCVTSDTKTTSVFVNNSPNVTLTANNLALCANSSAEALTGSPTGGSYLGTGVTGNTFNPTISGAGSHIVSYNFTNSNGCSGSANITFNVSLCTGVNEISNSDLVKVYPIPATDFITVEITDAQLNNSTIEVYDALGKIVLKSVIETPSTLLHINNLPKGIYLIRLQNEQFIYAKRILKE